MLHASNQGIITHEGFHAGLKAVSSISVISSTPLVTVRSLSLWITNYNVLNAALDLFWIPFLTTFVVYKMEFSLVITTASN